jgi:uncharacterized protein (DUF1499 family)
LIKDQGEITELGILSGKKPNNLGVTAGKLAPCPSSPNCVSSQGEGKHYIKPFTFVSDAANAWAKLRDILLNSEGVTLIEDSDTYIHAECRTKIMGFVDDLEFYLSSEEQVIHVRSASRLGYSDLEKNRKRVEKIREKFEL